ncbi:hypothetical protein RCL1_000778 [Eukaryota sp. TZLM3-RCL]
MQQALEVARTALDIGEVPVACVIVHNNQVIASGHNMTNITHNASRHAELEAIDKVLYGNTTPLFDSTPLISPSIFTECSLYVTVEPCGMCAAALKQLKFAKIVFGAKNDKFGGVGSVYKILEEQESDSFVCKSGLFAGEAILLLQEFYSKGNRNCPDEKRKRPLVT